MEDPFDFSPTAAILLIESPMSFADSEAWTRLAETLSMRWQHPVSVVDAGDLHGQQEACSRWMDSYAEQAYGRLVLLPVGVQSVALADWWPLIAKTRLLPKRMAIHVAKPFSLSEWTDLIAEATAERVRHVHAQFRVQSPTSTRELQILDHPVWAHALMTKYLDALACRSIDRYFEVSSKGVWNFHGELRQLDERIDGMLPSEYQARTEEVSPRSMGSAKLDSDEFGQVAWDQIWTSFCDLAMAGGPPHRGKLLEAVGREEVEQDRDAYDRVVREIRRGTEMVTELKTCESSALGWIGVICDDEAMAAWLMRAIIVENVMVRREAEVLYLPAGPKFTVKKEIKNVITSVAKTVHYWRAHLRCRETFAR